MNRQQWRDQVIETAIEPDLPIIDAHHHIWVGKPMDPYELYDPEWLYADKSRSGHNVIKTLYVDSHSTYRKEGPEDFKVVGETEFAHGIAEEAVRRGGRVAGACAIIVARANLLLGSAVGPVLDAHAAASPRFRGIRHMAAFVPELPPMYESAAADVMQQPSFYEGFAELAKRKLVFDALVLQPQLPEVTRLAQAFPDCDIVLNHLGMPLTVGRYQGKKEQSFADWKRDMADLAKCPKVYVKLGGLNMGLAGVDALARERPFTSEEMAAAQRHYFLTAIELFGPERCMFESNFPVDMYGISYEVVWNGYKRMTADCTPNERAMLFAGTAAKVYRVPL